MLLPGGGPVVCSIASRSAHKFNKLSILLGIMSIVITTHNIQVTATERGPESLIKRGGGGGALSIQFSHWVYIHVDRASIFVFVLVQCEAVVPTFPNDCITLLFHMTDRSPMNEYCVTYTCIVIV